MAPSKKKSKDKSKSGGGCLTCLIKFAGYLAAFLAVIFYSPILSKLGSVSEKRFLPEKFDGSFSENDVLSKAEHLFANQISGPESLSYYQGDLYTGTNGGNIVKIAKGKKMQPFVNIGNDSCKFAWKMSECGRVLGNRVDSKGNMYFIDTYFGLKKISLKESKPVPVTLMRSDQIIDGVSSHFLDDLVIHEGAGKSNGSIIYMTDASKVWNLDEVMILLLDREESGRVIAYDETTKEATVLVDNLSFPNGIELSDDKGSLIISELNKRRILRYYLKGAKKGNVEVLIDNLPGEPDNIRRSASKQETYWVALALARTSQQKVLADYFDELPIIRNLLIRIVYATGNLIELIGRAFDVQRIIEAGYRFKYIDMSIANDMMAVIGRLNGMALEIDSNGKVLNCLHAPDGKTTLLSEVREVRENNKRVLYLGSVINNYIGKVELK